MKIDIRDERPPVSTQRLEEAASLLAERGHPIPPSYRAFLAEQDGGEPVRNTFGFNERGRDQSDGVQVFIGIEPSPDGDLEEHVTAYAGRIPPGMLPFADDSFGNLLLLDARDGNDGPVWFWDHELEADAGETPDESNLSWVAPDLETFLAELTEPPELPPDPERPTGWRRLFSRG